MINLSSCDIVLLIQEGSNETTVCIIWIADYSKYKIIESDFQKWTKSMKSYMIVVVRFSESKSLLYGNIKNYISLNLTWISR